MIAGAPVLVTDPFSSIRTLTLDQPKLRRTAIDTIVSATVLIRKIQTRHISFTGRGTKLVLQVSGAPRLFQ